MSGAPPIPATCEHRPTIGGRVAPWINLPLADGGVDFRRHHRRLMELALQRGLCQVCGTRLGSPIVLLGGPEALNQLLFGEPPLHPECALYTTKACPIVAGELTKHPVGPSVSQGKRGKVCPTPGCDCAGWVPSTAQDAVDEPKATRPWYAVYATDYAIALRPDGSVFGAMLSPGQVLRVRLVSTPGEGRCWTVVSDALAEYQPPDTAQLSLDLPPRR